MKKIHNTRAMSKTLLEDGYAMFLWFCKMVLWRTIAYGLFF